MHEQKEGIRREMRENERFYGRKLKCRECIEARSHVPRRGVDVAIHEHVLHLGVPTACLISDPIKRYSMIYIQVSFLFIASGFGPVSPMLLHFVSNCCGR
jgi:hypothetical protein